MTNILKRYRKNEVIRIGTDNAPMNRPTFEIINIRINTRSKILGIEIEHFEENGLQPHSREESKTFDSLPAPVKVTGKAFLDAIETEILNLPQYIGATEV